MKAVIIDDESGGIKSLQYELQHNCPEIEVIKTYQNPEVALSEINNHQPELLFLDISMPQMDGFTFLESLGDRSFEVIFTTAYSQYALQAIKASAMDYLLKPIDGEELKQAISKVRKKWEEGKIDLLRTLEQKISELNDEENALISLPSMDGIEFVPNQKIIYCRADGSYTHIILEDRSPIMVSKSLKEIESIMPKRKFFRVHHSYLIHLNKIARYVKQDGGYLIMSNGDEVKISRQKKETFLKRM